MSVSLPVLMTVTVYGRQVGVEEGGVAAGYAVLSSPFLVSSE